MCNFAIFMGHHCTGKCLVMCGSAKHVKGTYEFVITIIVKAAYVSDTVTW